MDTILHKIHQYDDVEDDGDRTCLLDSSPTLLRWLLADLRLLCSAMPEVGLESSRRLMIMTASVGTSV